MSVENNEARWAQQEADTLAAIEKRRHQLAADKLADQRRIETLENIKSQRQELLDSGMTEEEIDALAAELAAEKAADVRETLERTRQAAMLATELSPEDVDAVDRQADAELKQREG